MPAQPSLPTLLQADAVDMSGNTDSSRRDRGGGAAGHQTPVRTKCQGWPGKRREAQSLQRENCDNANESCMKVASSNLLVSQIPIKSGDVALAFSIAATR